LANKGSNVEEQVRRDTLHLITKAESTEDLKQMIPYISQVLNFFIIDAMDAEIAAKTMIAGTIYQNIRKDKASYDEKFNPFELLAGVAYLFRQIALLHFMDRRHVEKPEFQDMIMEAVEKTDKQVSTVFKDNQGAWNDFLSFFREKYLSPWDIRRHSDYKTRANFGTGIDYITIP
jgi:hypothetical protein